MNPAHVSSTFRSARFRRGVVACLALNGLALGTGAVTRAAALALGFAGSIVTAAAAEKKAGADDFEPRETGKGSVALITDRIILDGIKQEARTYKTTPQGELRLRLFFPLDWTAADRRPAIIFFFGGRWSGGSALQFIPWGQYFASRGLVCALADYRIANIHKTNVDACVEDAKSAMRWVRGHASELGVDPNKLISSGGSSGGHLAAAVALVPGFDAPDDNGKISPVPNAMLLFNPALNLTQLPTQVTTADFSSLFSSAAGELIANKLSPTLFLTKGTVPAIMFYGTADVLMSHGDEFLAKSRALGNRCEMWIATDAKHGFFRSPPWLVATAIRADKFLASLGYLKGEPTLKPADNQAELTQVK